MFVMKKQISKSLLLIIIINLAVMFVVVVVLAKSDHDHDHHHSHSHKLNKAKRIYNGRRASREEAKCMAALLKQKGGGLTANERVKCSAVVITHDTVLTAAHCFDNISRSDILRWEVLPGSSHIDSAHYNTHKDLIRIIQDYHIHPEYDYQLVTYDLAIIKVGPTPWRLGGDDRMTVAQMPVRIKSERLPLKAYGYGLEDVNPLVWGNLNVIEYTRIYSQARWERMSGERFDRPNILFATKERSNHQHHPHRIVSGQAHGDSGGGVFSHGKVERLDTSTNRWIEIDTEILVGIHSHDREVKKHRTWRKIFFHTNVSTFMPWITRFSDARFITLN